MLAKAWKVEEITRDVLEENLQRCNPVKEFILDQLGFEFQFQLKQSSNFEKELSLDLILLESKAETHIVDIATQFSGATFLDSNRES